METGEKLLIYNAHVHTMAGKEYETGFVRAENGVITQVGQGAATVRPGESAADAGGLHLYPGFVDAHTHLGMCEDGLTFEGDDCNEETDPVTPHLRTLDAVNPLDRCFTEAVRAGVTTVVTGPGSANPIAGQLAALKTFGTRVDDMVVKAPVAMKMALGENPKNVYHSKDRSPTTRMATAALIREQLFKAQRYAEEKERAQNDGDYDEPEFDIKCEALLPVLRRECQVHIHAHRADDIYTAIRIAGEFHLDYVIVHGTEGHLIANGLKKEGARILAGPIFTDRSKPELRNQSPETPGLLSKAGVLTAIITDHPETPAQYLPACAALAVREGMDHEEALRAITCNPAVICGLEKRVGSLEPGKDADFVLFRGDPISLMNQPEMVFVLGNRVK